MRAYLSTYSPTLHPSLPPFLPFSILPSPTVEGCLRTHYVFQTVLTFTPNLLPQLPKNRDRRHELRMPFKQVFEAPLSHLHFFLIGQQSWSPSVVVAPASHGKHAPGTVIEQLSTVEDCGGRRHCGLPLWLVRSCPPPLLHSPQIKQDHKGTLHIAQRNANRMYV